MSLPAIRTKQNRRMILFAVLLVAGLYILVPQFGAFRSSWHLLRHPHTTEVIVATLFTLLTYPTSAATYYLLAFKRLAYRQVVLVQLAAMFINRLVPAGMGAVGANYAYLRHNRHSTAQAAGTVSINNLLGFVGHGLLLVVILVIFAGHQTNIGSRIVHAPAYWLLGVIIAIVIVASIVVLTKGRLQHLLRETGTQLLSYRQRPFRLLLALVSSMGLTTCNVASLFFCALALGVHLPFVVLLLVFTFGVGAGVATPTPGGLGGFEAGLVAGMVTYHVASPLALAVALLYRLVSYWLPLLIGALAFIICQRRQLFVSL